MKKENLLYLLLSLLAVVGVSSCSETNDDEDTEYANWQERNETYFTNIYNTAKSNTDGSWKVIPTWSMNDSVATKATDNIVVKVLTKGSGSGCPLYNDSVRVAYRGQLMPTDSFPSGKVFDGTWTTEYSPATMSAVILRTNYVVDGFSTALQNMHIGDRWLVYIPYTLGYGTTDSGTIPAYSTLVFDITLLAYYHPGATIPTWQAKKNNVWIEE
jgi:FKBP-type peptidyl-prolyl cis-trans isomerase FklB